MSHVCIITARFYADISAELEKGARAVLQERKVSCDITEVPGAFEIPGAVRMAIESGKYDGYVALGCVIRGETTHYDYVCAESARGLMQLSMRHRAAIGYGILTVENEEQAWVRAKIAHGNKGAAAAEACLRMMEIRKQWGAA